MSDIVQVTFVETSYVDKHKPGVAAEVMARDISTSRGLTEERKKCGLPLPIRYKIRPATREIGC
jgi:hypothetical protein